MYLYSSQVCNYGDHDYLKIIKSLLLYCMFIKQGFEEMKFQTICYTTIIIIIIHNYISVGVLDNCTPYACCHLQAFTKMLMATCASCNCH